MWIEIGILILGFIVLIKGADWLVNGSVSLAKHYKVSELVIGLTIVAFGTSAPELVVNVISSIKGLGDVTLGNVVGSNLFNLLLILGISGLIFPLIVNVKTIWREIPYSLLAAVVLLILANFSLPGYKSFTIDRSEGIFLLALFVFFMFYIFKNLKQAEQSIETSYKIFKPGVSLILIAIGLGALVFGSRIVVDNAVKLATILGASEKVIGVTIISAGTSLPELVTSVVAALRKKSDIAMGNIIGSNIFNILLILGLSAVISPINYNISFNLDIILLIVATIVLFVFMFSGKKLKLDRWEAGCLLAAYLGYMVWLLW